MVNPVKNVKIVKKRRKIFKRHQSDRYKSVKVYAACISRASDVYRLYTTNKIALTYVCRNHGESPKELTIVFVVGSRVSFQCPRLDMGRTKRPNIWCQTGSKSF